MKKWSHFAQLELYWRGKRASYISYFVPEILKFETAIQKWAGKTVYYSTAPYFTFFDLNSYEIYSKSPKGIEKHKVAMPEL